MNELYIKIFGYVFDIYVIILAIIILTGVVVKAAYYTLETVQKAKRKYEDAKDNDKRSVELEKDASRAV